MEIDVYCVIEAFGITCGARAHALKKLLCAGQRGKGTEIQDLEGVIASTHRAVQLQKTRNAKISSPTPSKS